MHYFHNFSSDSEGDD